jgi:hypothetical protein
MVLDLGTLTAGLSNICRNKTLTAFVKLKVLEILVKVLEILVNMTYKKLRKVWNLQ